MHRLVCLCCVFTLLAAAAAPLQAQVFKCKAPNGTVVYQDGPCAGGEKIDARPASSGVASPKGSQAASDAGSEPIATKPTHPVLPEKMRR